jgi:hypothetical protein
MPRGGRSARRPRVRAACSSRRRPTARPSPASPASRRASRAVARRACCTCSSATRRRCSRRRRPSRSRATSSRSRHAPRRAPPLTPRPSPPAAQNLAFSPSEDNITCTLENCQAFVLNLSSTEVVKTDETSFEPLALSFHSGAITGMDVCARKTLLVTCSADKSVRVWNYAERTLDVMKTFNDTPLAVAVHPTGIQMIVTFAESLRVVNLLVDDMLSFYEASARARAHQPRRNRDRLTRCPPAVAVARSCRSSAARRCATATAGSSSPASTTSSSTSTRATHSSWWRRFRGTRCVRASSFCDGQSLRRRWCTEPRYERAMAARRPHARGLQQRLRHRVEHSRGPRAQCLHGCVACVPAGGVPPMPGLTPSRSARGNRGSRRRRRRVRLGQRGTGPVRVRGPVRAVAAGRQGAPARGRRHASHTAVPSGAFLARAVRGHGGGRAAGAGAAALGTARRGARVRSRAVPTQRTPAAQSEQCTDYECNNGPITHVRALNPAPPRTAPVLTRVCAPPHRFAWPPTIRTCSLPRPTA